MISICIPVYDMAGRGVEMLRELIASIRMQTFQDYEIVVSDTGGNFPALAALFNSRDSNASYLPGRLGAAANLNNAIDHAKGDNPQGHLATFETRTPEKSGNCASHPSSTSRYQVRPQPQFSLRGRPIVWKRI